MGAIAVGNFFLIIVTLGVYYFWGKARVRRFIWSCVELDHEALEYTGTGKELFLGFLIVFFFVLVPLGIIQNGLPFFFDETTWQYWAIYAATFLVILYLINVGYYRARRYRLSRSLWRGIRGSMAGSSWAYGAYAFGMFWLVPLSLGLAYPWVNFKLYQKLLRETEFGNRQFQFNGHAGKLYRQFLANWALFVLIFVPVLGLILWAASSDFTWEAVIGDGLLAIVLCAPVAVFLVFRYRAFELNYVASCTSFEGAIFSLNVSGLGLIGVWLWNLVIVIFTLGLAAPFALRNVTRYFVERLGLAGTLDFAAIQQSQRAADRVGEGLAEAFDVDAF